MALVVFLTTRVQRSSATRSLFIAYIAVIHGTDIDRTGENFIFFIYCNKCLFMIDPPGIVNLLSAGQHNLNYFVGRKRRNKSVKEERKV